jgi:hypothetical protein
LPPLDEDGDDSIADPTSTTTPPPLAAPREPTLSSAADKAEEGAAAASALLVLPILLVPPLALLRGVMARCCFSRICLILAARREAVEAFEDILAGWLC